MPDIERAPGRPYFTPAGAAALQRHLDAERRRAADTWSRDSFTLSTDGQGRPASSAAQEGQAHLRGLSESIHGVELLFGPGAAAALRAPIPQHPGEPWHHTIPADRVQALGELLLRMDGTAFRWEDEAGRQGQEIKRLEGELALAQEAHDEQARTARLYLRNVEALAYSEQWWAAYTRFLEARWEKLLGERSLKVARRDATKAAHAETIHGFRPDEEGTCSWCGADQVAPQHTVEDDA